MEQQRDYLETLAAFKTPEDGGHSVVLLQPFDDLEKFKEFDENIKEVKDQLLSEFRSIGGGNITVATRRLLTYIMTDNVAQHYSWLGNNGKQMFCNLNL
ncbi:hypothetical protein V5799_015238 [Amblyomma americanum]|uniref:DUF4806 domain-containing protein n=1 Tax=Amblyomma americanum TaxID=6943 RepID=A0AAQ4E0Q7_AMBAM